MAEKKRNVLQRITKNAPVKTFASKMPGMQNSVKPGDVGSVDRRTELPLVVVPVKQHAAFPGLDGVLLHFFDSVESPKSGKPGKIKMTEKFLAVTDDTIYLTGPKADIKRSIKVAFLQGIFWDPSNGMFGLRMRPETGEPDALFRLPDEQERQEELVHILNTTWKYQSETEEELPVAKQSMAPTMTPPNLHTEKPKGWKLKLFAPMPLQDLEYIHKQIDRIDQGDDEEDDTGDEEKRRRAAELAAKKAELAAQSFAQNVEMLVKQEADDREHIEDSNDALREDIERWRTTFVNKAMEILYERERMEEELKEQESRQEEIVIQLKEAMDKGKRQHEEVADCKLQEAVRLEDMMQRLVMVNENLQRSQNEVSRARGEKEEQLRSALAALGIEEQDAVQTEIEENRRNELLQLERSEHLKELMYRQRQQQDIHDLQGHLDAALRHLADTQHKLLNVYQQNKDKDRRLVDQKEKEEEWKKQAEKNVHKLREEIQEVDQDNKKKQQREEDELRRTAEARQLQYEEWEDLMLANLDKTGNQLEVMGEEFKQLKSEHDFYESQERQQLNQIRSEAERDLEKLAEEDRAHTMFRARLEWEVKINSIEIWEKNREKMNMSAWLWKSQGVFASWQRRWCSIDEHWMWHITENEDKPIALFKTSTIAKVTKEPHYNTSHMTPPPGDKYTRGLGFSVTLTDGKKHHFCAETKSNMLDWMHALNLWRKWFTTLQTSEGNMYTGHQHTAQRGTSPFWMGNRKGESVPSSSPTSSLHSLIHPAGRGDTSPTMSSPISSLTASPISLHRPQRTDPPPPGAPPIGVSSTDDNPHTQHMSPGLTSRVPPVPLSEKDCRYVKNSPLVQKYYQRGVGTAILADSESASGYEEDRGYNKGRRSLSASRPNIRRSRSTPEQLTLTFDQHPPPPFYDHLVSSSTDDEPGHEYSRHRGRPISSIPKSPGHKTFIPPSKRDHSPTNIIGLRNSPTSSRAFSNSTGLGQFSFPNNAKRPPHPTTHPAYIPTRQTRDGTNTLTPANLPTTKMTDFMSSAHPPPPLLSSFSPQTTLNTTTRTNRDPPPYTPTLKAPFGSRRTTPPRASTIQRARTPSPSGYRSNTHMLTNPATEKKYEMSPRMLEIQRQLLKTPTGGP